MDEVVKQRRHGLKGGKRKSHKPQHLCVHVFYYRPYCTVFEICINEWKRHRRSGKTTSSLYKKEEREYAIDCIMRILQCLCVGLCF